MILVVGGSGDLGSRIVRRLRREQNPLAAPAGPPPGASQPDGRQAEPRPTPIPRRDTGPRRLVVTEGPLRGTTLPLAQSAILIGRAPSCTLVLDDDYSSSRHARVYPEAGQWLVEDLGSTNGTYVDRQRVDGPTPVRPGSQIRVGQSTLELQR